MFTVISCSWILWMFYIIVKDIILAPGSFKSWVKDVYLPSLFVLLLLSLAWFPFFALVLVGNNPHRSKWWCLVSLFGILCAHALSAYVMYELVHKIMIGDNEFR